MQKVDCISKDYSCQIIEKRGHLKPGITLESLVLTFITQKSSQCSDEPAHRRSLARAFAAGISTQSMEVDKTLDQTQRL